MLLTRTDVENRERINKRCELLESLGFTINHNDSDVSMNGKRFDFSAIELTVPNVLYHVINEVHTGSYKEGEISTRRRMREALGFDK
jgi:hypothetical protein